MDAIEKQKQTAKKYRESEKGRVAAKRYRDSEKGKQTAKIGRQKRGRGVVENADQS